MVAEEAAEVVVSVIRCFGFCWAVAPAEVAVVLVAAAVVASEAEVAAALVVSAEVAEEAEALVVAGKIISLQTILISTDIRKGKTQSCVFPFY